MFSLRRNRRNEAWEGVVLDKSRGMTDGSNMYHHLRIKLPDGTSKRVRVGRDLWNSVQAGDSVIKTSGGEPAKK